MSPEKPRYAIERQILPRGRHVQEWIAKENVVIVPKNPAKSVEAHSHGLLVLDENRIRFDEKRGTLRIVTYSPIPPKGREPMKDEADSTSPLVKIVYEEWRTYPDIETAIRATRHIKDIHHQDGGRVVQDAHKVIDLVKDLSVELQQPGITREAMRDMAIKAANTLVETGYVNAKKEAKLRIVKEIMRAAAEDSLNRVNPSRSRVILSNAWVNFLTRSLFEYRMVYDKYTSINAMLQLEREIERFYLQQAQQQADYLRGLRPGNNEIRSAKHRFQVLVYNFLSHEAVRLAPYAKVADTVRFMVLGKMDEHDYSVLERYLGKEDAKNFFEMKEFDRLTGPELKARLKEISENIASVLEQGEDNLLSEEERENMNIPKTVKS